MDASTAQEGKISKSSNCFKSDVILFSLYALKQCIICPVVDVDTRGSKVKFLRLTDLNNFGPIDKRKQNTNPKDTKTEINSNLLSWPI